MRPGPRLRVLVAGGHGHRPGIAEQLAHMGLTLFDPHVAGDLERFDRRSGGLGLQYRNPSCVSSLSFG